MKNMNKAKLYSKYKSQWTCDKGKWYIKNGQKETTAALLVFPAGNAGNKIHLGSAMPLGLEPELVSKEQAEEDWNRDVVCDEGRGVPIALEEDAPVGEEDDDDGPDQTPPSGIRHEFTVPWEVFGVDALRLQAMSETDASDTDTEPIEHSRDGAHVAKPAENGI